IQLLQPLHSHHRSHQGHQCAPRQMKIRHQHVRQMKLIPRRNFQIRRAANFLRPRCVKQNPPRHRLQRPHRRRPHHHHPPALRTLLHTRPSRPAPTHRPHHPRGTLRRHSHTPRPPPPLPPLHQQTPKRPPPRNPRQKLIPHLHPPARPQHHHPQSQFLLRQEQ